MAHRACGAPASLLAALLLQLVALGVSSTRPPRSLTEALLPGDSGWPVTHGQRASAEGGRRRRGLQQKPLPNFEIGVPGPPKKQLGWVLLPIWNGHLHGLTQEYLPPYAPPPLPPTAAAAPAPTHHPPARSRWQATAVRERTQELSSSSFVAPNHPGLGYVALCVVARDAHPDMLEWLNHHIRYGMAWLAGRLKAGGEGEEGGGAPGACTHTASGQAPPVSKPIPPSLCVT